MEQLRVRWQNLADLYSLNYTCGFCGSFVATDHGWYCQGLTGGGRVPLDITVRVCPHCARPTYFEGSEQYPAVPFGGLVKELPAPIEALYMEARKSCAAGAFTGAVLLLRKLLMNIAVNVGAEQGRRFIEYVDYLGAKGYVPPNGQGWVDHIRKKGNEATHEIALMTKNDAEELITFSEMLLKIIYEFPKRVPAATRVKS